MGRAHGTEADSKTERMWDAIDPLAVGVAESFASHEAARSDPVWKRAMREPEHSMTAVLCISVQ